MLRQKPTPLKTNNKGLLSTQNLSHEDRLGSRKLLPKFCGPFENTDKTNNVTIQLDIPHPVINKIIHVTFFSHPFKRFKKDLFSITNTTQRAIMLEDGSTEYLVENIVSQRLKQGKKEYFVIWMIYPDHGKTWKMKINFRNCKDLSF